MTTPKCGVHVATAMVLAEAKAPSWLISPEGADEVLADLARAARTKAGFQRKFWKCPVDGCFRVAAYAPTDEEEKRMAERPCSKCGEPTTGRVYCADCLHNYHEKRNADRRAKRAARAGVGKGFYASAKARRRARESQPANGETDFAFVIRGGELVPIAAVSPEASA